MKPSGIGGQAVLEGVMMKNKDQYAVAVRKPDQSVVVEKKEYHSATEKYRILGLPFVRGVVNFAESMVLGMRTLTFSASFYEEEETVEPGKLEKKLDKLLGEKAESFMMGCTVLISILLAIGIFMLLPFWVAGLLEKVIASNTILTLIEGVIRIVIFIGYVLAISLMKDIRRVFMYHGAEHKSINCIEHGLPLTVENVKGQSTRHKRCGTSFLLFVVLLSVLFFMFIRVDNVWMRMLMRVLLIPVIAGVSYELLRLAGRSENPVIDILSKPGLWLQGLTTREPDEDMIKVAIQSVEAVFDWREFLGIAEEEGAEDGTAEPTAGSKARSRRAKPRAAGGKQGATERKDAGSGRNEKQGAKPGGNEKQSTKPDGTEKKDVGPGGNGKQGAKPAEAENKVQETEIAATAEPDLEAEQRERRERLKARASGKPSEPYMLADPAGEDDEDDDILNALDRFFTDKREEKSRDK